jgi:Tfp pilus assembly protein PilZ
METHVDPETLPKQDVHARRFARVPFNTPVRLTRLATGQVLELMARDLSHGGLFVETVIPLPVGELFRVSVPDAPEGFDEVAVARVAWRRAFTPSRPAGLPPGIGLAFLLMRPADRRALADVVDAGGVRLPETSLPAPVPSRTPVAPPPAPRDLGHLVPGPFATDDLVDLGPGAWLLLAALSLAATALLLSGLQPLP